MVTLLCTVRACRQPLLREERRYVCARKHSFDIARSGYVNLLQPQDKKSLTPGDTREAAMSRRRFLERFWSAAAMPPLSVRADALLDVGCGEGTYLNAFEASEKHGLDISTPAIEAAAKKYKDALFVIANADRFLPYADGSFDVVTSITARMNPGEFHRVLKEDGKALIALPAEDDLIELRESILGEAKLIDRVQRTVDDFSSHFALERHERIQHKLHLDRDAIQDVMTSSYRGLRTKQRERLAALAEIDVTLSRDLLLFTSLPPPARQS